MHRFHIVTGYEYQEVQKCAELFDTVFASFINAPSTIDYEEILTDTDTDTETVNETKTKFDNLVTDRNEI